MSSIIWKTISQLQKIFRLQTKSKTVKFVLIIFKESKQEYNLPKSLSTEQ